MEKAAAEGSGRSTKLLQAAQGAGDFITIDCTFLKLSCCCFCTADSSGNLRGTIEEQRSLSRCQGKQGEDNRFEQHLVGWGFGPLSVKRGLSCENENMRSVA